MALKFPGRDEAVNALAGYIVDIALASADPPDFPGVDIHANDAEAGFGKLDRERQTDIAQTNDGDPRFPSGYSMQQILFVAHASPEISR